ncbi:MAG: hypothetical protein ACLFRD_01155 [Nitriliruptoraceae bacterium]
MADATGADDPDLEVVEVVPGELDVVLGDRRVRVLLPAGVGVPGADDVEVAAAVVAELRERGRTLPRVVDVSAELVADASLLEAVAARIG